ncbi:MAG: ACP S-malonyltransferase [Granulosicoccus sp.]
MTFAVVFPGQGSQSVGMLAALAEQHDEIASTFAEASDILGKDLWQLAQQGPAEALSDTRVTQPLMFIADIAVWRILQSQGLGTPAAVAGHSLGEFAALVASNALSFSDAVTLVNERAMLMAAAVPEGEGGMAALLGMEDQAVVDLCASISGDRISEAVNFNSPGQVAISGHLDAIEKTVAAAREQGCRKAMMLAVSVPNHSSLMKPAGIVLCEKIDQLSFSNPQMPLIQNATARAAEDLPTMLGHLKSHVYNPVYWTRTIETLRDVHGVSLIIESGPGKVLAGLSKRIDRALPTLPVESPDTLAKALEAASTHVELHA